MAASIEPSAGSVDDSCGNACAEAVRDLCKAALFWRSFEAMEFGTLGRLTGPIGSIAPAEAGQRYYALLDSPALVA